ncbi:MAG TPA: thiamine pyrophosphate-requiring protein [Candidatus Cybelea sp.]|jgi:pyruvate dehydrogenase (quinone)|nr:thiamine pyrophosphate-requiring protein [Candidatus Cybelea sp.]
MNVSDYLWERLHEWDVRRIYGYPGDGINGILGALARSKRGIEFVQVRHEEMAAFMACAHAKFTGEVGVCLATSGPGAIHLLNGLYDAKLDKTPVVAIVGQAATTALGGSYQQEVDLQRLFADVSEYAYTVCSPTAIRHVIDRAFRTAAAMRGVATVIVPKDIQEKQYAEPPRKHNTLHSSAGYSAPIVVPEDRDLRRAADALNAGERVAILVGAGAIRATEEVVAVAERLGAGVAKALLGKAAVPDDLPYVTGTLGLLGTRASSDMMNECDTLLMIGTAYPYAEFLPKEGQARGIQIDIDPRYIGLRYPTEVNLIGDAATTLRALLPLLVQKADSSWRDKIEKNRHDFEELERRRAHEGAQPLNPQLVFLELNKHLPHNAIVTGDAGTATNWSARNLHMRRGMKWSLSGGLATMGGAVPYAIAAKFAYPDRVSIACTGDGAMQMNGSAELLTVMKYWKSWHDPRIIFLVLHNDDLNQVTWEMRVESGDPKYEASQNLPAFPYAAYAESIGMRGIRVDDPAELGDAWRQAFTSARPVLVEAIVDSNVAQLPPHITLEEAHNLFSALSKGDPNEGGVIKESIKSILAGVIPRTSE